MASLNKVFLIGNITRDPEIRYTPGGSALCVLGLAVNRKFTTSKGEERDETCFLDLEVWGKQAESCHNYLRKGAPVFTEGRLRFDQWEDRETGRKRNRILVVAERVQFLGSPSRSAEFENNNISSTWQRMPPEGQKPGFSEPPPFPKKSGREMAEPSMGNIGEQPGIDEEPMDDIPF